MIEEKVLPVFENYFAKLNSVRVLLQLTEIYCFFCLEILPTEGNRQYIFQLSTENDQNLVCSVNQESVRTDFVLI